jgi:hypothetical protein
MLKLLNPDVAAGKTDKIWKVSHGISILGQFKSSIPAIFHTNLTTSC